jgi:hypothetical protein
MVQLVSWGKASKALESYQRSAHGEVVTGAASVPTAARRFSFSKMMASRVGLCLLLLALSSYQKYAWATGSIAVPPTTAIQPLFGELQISQQRCLYRMSMRCTS